MMIMCSAMTETVSSSIFGNFMKLSEPFRDVHRPDAPNAHCYPHPLQRFSGTVSSSSGLEFKERGLGFMATDAISLERLVFEVPYETRRWTPIAQRSFELQEWYGFMQGACLNSDLHTMARGQRENLRLENPGTEKTAETRLYTQVFHVVNSLADRLGLKLRYDGASGGGRSLSNTGHVIIDLGVKQDLSKLCARVFGNGECKPPWEWSLEHIKSTKQLGQALGMPGLIQDCVQQLFGNMILDENRYGFITNFNETVFFRRPEPMSRLLEFSPLVRIEDAPLEKFLFVLALAERDGALKPRFSRLLLEEPGCCKDFPSKQVDQVLSAFDSRIQTYDLNALGITGAVYDLLRCGNLVEGHIGNTRLAIKLFNVAQDLCSELVNDAFTAEQEAYARLKDLQGRLVPVLLGVGRIPHTNMVFLAFEWDVEYSPCDLQQAQQHMNEILTSLQEIHARGVLHNDLQDISNVLWKEGCGPKFVNFDDSLVDANKEDMDGEMERVRFMLT